MRHKLMVKADTRLTRRPGRCEFRPARIAGCDATGALVASLSPKDFSARIGFLAAADGLAIVPSNQEEIRKGDFLEFLPF